MDMFIRKEHCYGKDTDKYLNCPSSAPVFLFSRCSLISGIAIYQLQFGKLCARFSPPHCSWYYHGCHWAFSR